MLDLFQCIKQCAPIATIESLVSPLVKVNSITNINVPRGLLSPQWRQTFAMLESANISRKHLFSFLTLQLYFGKGGFRRRITWHITVNLCWISWRSTSIKAVIVSPNISGSAEGSRRSLDPISTTKMSGFVALVALRS